VTEKKLGEFLSLENAPVKMNGQLTWTTDIDVDEID
jgi:hypothetical protein